MYKRDLMLFQFLRSSFYFVLRYANRRSLQVLILSSMRFARENCLLYGKRSLSAKIHFADAILIFLLLMQNNFFLNRFYAGTATIMKC